MPFTNRDFPGQVFDSIEEFDEAGRKRVEVEESLAGKAGEIVKVTATVIPAPNDLLARKVVSLEKRLQEVSEKLDPAPTHNKEGLQIGLVLRGESKGRSFTLEVLDEGYCCSDGVIYESLSGAALGVSGNRRSGWKFWTDVAGNPVGETTGRFKKDVSSNPFDSRAMS
jgi:hypothetical protein